MRQTALMRAAKGANTDVEKARAIYEWIVENTLRDPKTRGCGTGNIKAMLENGNLGGKCADLNALFVGAGASARHPRARRLRHPRGQLVARLQEPGRSSPVISKAQHCRAEFFAAGIGWVPVDPADVRKVVLEEPPGNWRSTTRRWRPRASGSSAPGR